MLPTAPCVGHGFPGPEAALPTSFSDGFALVNVCPYNGTPRINFSLGAPERSEIIILKFFETRNSVKQTLIQPIFHTLFNFF